MVLPEMVMHACSPVTGDKVHVVFLDLRRFRLRVVFIEQYDGP